MSPFIAAVPVVCALSLLSEDPDSRVDALVGCYALEVRSASLVNATRSLGLPAVIRLESRRRFPGDVRRDEPISSFVEGTYAVTSTARRECTSRFFRLGSWKPEGPGAVWIVWTNGLGRFQMHLHLEDGRLRGRATSESDAIDLSRRWPEYDVTARRASCEEPTHACPWEEQPLQAGPYVGFAVVQAVDDRRAIVAVDTSKEGHERDGIADHLFLYTALHSILLRSIEGRFAASVELYSSGDLVVRAVDGQMRIDFLLNSTPVEPYGFEPGARLDQTLSIAHTRGDVPMERLSSIRRLRTCDDHRVCFEIDGTRLEFPE